MEVIGLLVAAFVLLRFIFGNSSDSGEHPETRDRQNRRNSGINNLRPDYPPWMAPPDWQDLEYDYYRRPRFYSFWSVAAAYFKGAIIMAIIAGLAFFLLFYSKEKPIEPQGGPPIGETVNTGKEGTVKLRSTKEKKQASMPKAKPLAVKSSYPLDILTLQAAKLEFPELEYYCTRDKRYYAVILKGEHENEMLNNLVFDWRKKHMKKFGFNLTFYPTSKLCEEHVDNIIHGNEPFTWICKACER